MNWIMKSENIEEYENEMRWVFRYVLNNDDLNNLDNDERRLLKECVDAGYIEGIELSEAASGLIVGQIKYDPVLTRAGVNFLSREEPTQEGITQSPSESVDKWKYKTLKRIIEGILITVVSGWILWRFGWS